MPSDAQPKTSGIYAIKNGGRQYIGHSSDIPQRWRQHRYLLRSGKHHNPHLQNAWNLYGEEDFEFIILEECPVEQLLEQEQHYFDIHSDKYNCGSIAKSRLGVPQSPETIARMRVAQTGSKATDETKAKMSAAHMGHDVSDETRERISATKMGNTNRVGLVTPLETRKRISASMMGKRNSAGHVHTPESREKMRTAALAREARKREERENRA